MGYHHVRHSIILFIICLPIELWPQRTGSANKDSIPSFITYSDKITLQLFAINTFNAYTFGDRHSSLEAELRPNKQDRIGARVSYGPISLAFSVAPQFLADNRDNKGSSLFSFSTGVITSRWLQTVEIHKEKGFYTRIAPQEIYLPDVRNFKMGGSTSYILNPLFSLRGWYNQDTKQLRSAGSLVPGITYFYSHFRLIAEGLPEEESLKSVDVGFTPGYFYNWVPWPDVMIGMGVSAGIGFNYSHSQEESLVSLLTETGYGLQLNYDSGTFFAGGQYRYLALHHNSDRATYTRDHIPSFQLFAGYRFNPPKKLSELKEKWLPSGK